MPAAPARAHLRRLVRAGATAEWIAEHAGVAERTVRAVLSGERTHLYRGTAAALLGLDARPGPSARRVDPGPTRALLDDLLARHWPVHVVTELAGLAPRTLAPSNTRTGVSEQTAAAVREVHARLAEREGPAPRPYPWLAEHLSGHRPADVARDAGVSEATVRRAADGQPLARTSAQALARWVTTRRTGSRTGA